MEFYNVVQIILVGVLVLITGYYAWQTRRQANSLDFQLKAMAEQRKKSIEPLLIIEDVSNPWNDKKALESNITLDVRNTGIGLALDLDISASATLRLSNQTTQKITSCEFNWRLKKPFIEFYFKPGDHYGLSLKLSKTAIYNPIMEKMSMHVKFDYRDIDQTHYTCEETIYFSDDMQTKTYRDKIITKC